MSDFIKHYARISDLSEDQVVTLLELQDKQDTRYSRVKTCKELWSIQESQIKHLNDLIYELSENLKAAEDQNHYLTLMQEYRDQNYELRRELDKLSQENADLRKTVETLRSIF